MADHIPGFDVTIGGRTLTHESPDGAERVVIEDSLEGIGRAEITLHAASSSWQVAIGTEVVISVAGASEDVFFGYVWSRRVTVRNGGKKLVITALGPLVQMMTTIKTQVFENKKDSEVIETLIGDAGLSVGSVTATSRVWDSIVQRTENHLEFARRLCARNGLWLFAKVDKVHAECPAATGQAVSLKMEDIIELDSHVAEGTYPSEVHALGWDYVKKEPVTASFSEDRDFGPGKPISRSFWKTPMYLPNIWVDDQQTAQSMAEAVFNRHSMSIQKGRVRCKGRGDLRAGAKVMVEDLGAGFGPGGLVMASRHVVSSTRGYEVEATFQSGVDWA